MVLLWWAPYVYMLRSDWDRSPFSAQRVVKTPPSQQSARIIATLSQANPPTNRPTNIIIIIVSWWCCWRLVRQDSPKPKFFDQLSISLRLVAVCILLLCCRVQYIYVYILRMQHCLQRSVALTDDIWYHQTYVCRLRCGSNQCSRIAYTLRTRNFAQHANSCELLQMFTFAYAFLLLLLKHIQSVWMWSQWDCNEIRDVCYVFVDTTNRVRLANYATNICGVYLVSYYHTNYIQSNYSAFIFAKPDVHYVCIGFNRCF